eukprot:TRINITY_DN9812_c0_g1_i1.p1 TRINITY_DN9812_c0_g1~~TRINITY_DN9812_c0_g1_i1.p1  ORF type:complete len:486 (-),score=93.02 TRINITY_DN9812_c0_g1_i1:238-1695(-)
MDCLAQRLQARHCANSLPPRSFKVGLSRSVALPEGGACKFRGHGWKLGSVLAQERNLKVNPAVSPGPSLDAKKLSSLSGVVTDDTVPEGHKGLHGFLYGEGGADVHSSQGKEFTGKGQEDDGSTILGFQEYVDGREAFKFAGVYAVYGGNGVVQYVGYSRNVVLSLKALRSRVGDVRCASVKVKLYVQASLVTRSRLEEEKQRWLDALDSVPVGNSVDADLWEGSGSAVPLSLMSEQERTEYEEKKLKMRKAMGENLFDEVQGEDDDSRTRRLKLLQATEGDDWSSVIDGQTKQTYEGAVSKASEKAVAQQAATIVSPFAKPGATSGGLYSAESYEFTKENVDLVLNDVRPYLVADGGNVEVVDVSNGIVSLRLQGACGTCPSSTSTMKMGIERVLLEKFGDSIKEVVQVDRQEIGATVAAVNAHLEILKPAILNYGGAVEVVSVCSGSGQCRVKYRGPAPIGAGIRAAIKDKFPDIKDVILLDY